MPLHPGAMLPLERPSWVTVEKLSAVRRDRIGSQLGRLSEAELRILTQRLVVLLGAA